MKEMYLCVQWLKISLIFKIESGLSQKISFSIWRMRNSLLVYVFIIVTCFAIKCSEEGFREYLSLYSFKYGESLDSYVEYRVVNRIIE